MSNKNGDPIIMECSFCRHAWKTERPNYKIFFMKTLGGKRWQRYVSLCPLCKRETTVTMEIK